MDHHRMTITPSADLVGGVRSLFERFDFVNRVSKLGTMVRRSTDPAVHPALHLASRSNS